MANYLKFQTMNSDDDSDDRMSDLDILDDSNEQDSDADEMGDDALNDDGDEVC